MPSRPSKRTTHYFFRAYLLLSMLLMAWTYSDVSSFEATAYTFFDIAIWLTGFYVIFRLAFGKVTKFGKFWLAYLVCAVLWDLYSFASDFEFDTQLSLWFWLIALLMVLLLLVPQYLGIYLYATNYNKRNGK